MKSILLRSVFVLLFGMTIALPVQAGLKIGQMLCEYQKNPIGLDIAQPGLTWKLLADRRDEQQIAYRVLVASSLENLAREHGDLWDSGKVVSDATTQIRYAGQPLPSRSVCFWKVRSWDKDDKASRWSNPSSWEMGLVSGEDWQAQWLNDGKANPVKDEDFYKEDPAPLFRKEFLVSKRIARARLYVSGIGYYQASLNGQRVGDHLLDPGWTRYSERVLYSTYDVTDQLRRGANCLGVALGNGWYNPLPLRMWGHLNLRQHLPVGRPRFIARLEVDFTDGTRCSVVSDTSWKVGEGAIRFNSIYLGEIYDAQRELPGWDRPGFDDAGWRQPVVATEPVGALRAQAQPPIQVTKTLKPVKVTEPKPGVFIFDMGQNFSGWANLNVSAPAGTKIILRYGELLNPDGTLNPMTSVAGQIKRMRKDEDGREISVGGPGAPPIAWQGDTYIAKGRGVESYTPQFTFHAFRYVEVTGLPGKPSRDLITGLRLNTAVEPVGSFTCSNEQFNRIQEMCDWTFRSNLFSVQSDCPHRERFGYGGDLVVTSEAFMMNYDMANFYAKSVRDWKESAFKDGMLTDTAPFIGIQYCGPAWAMAHPLMLRQLHQYYGNRQLIEEQYETAKRWLDLEAGKHPDLIVAKGLSDHEALVPASAPAMVTPLFAASAKTLSELAVILGRSDEAEKYQRLAADIQKAYLKKFLNPPNGQVGPGTQASQAFALYLDLVPAEQRRAVMQFLLDDIRGPREHHLTTGIFGTKFMLDVLSREGHADVATSIVNQKTFPGWGYMLENGATTLWEHWKWSDNTFSHNHPMFGSVSQWFYHWLGGIQPAPDAVGFHRIIIRPQLPKDLNWVRCKYNSVRGQIVSNWKREGDKLTMEITIPANATATVYVPAKDAAGVTESGVPTGKVEGVKFLRMENGAAVYAVGSGAYRFQSALLPAPLASDQIDFGAYYTELKTGQEWESSSRTGKDADIVVRVSKAGGQLVFWRGNSYLPYWKTDKGQWDLTEIVLRSGDGAKPMPDRVNSYSHVAIIENTPSLVVVHWRYLASFTPGNPHGNVSPNNFVDEVFTITPGGQVKRVIKKGTDKIDDWRDPLNQTSQTLQLSATGIAEISRKVPKHSVSQTKIKSNPGKGPVVVAPSLWFKFDEGLGDETTEDISKTSPPIPVHKTLWKKGVSGTALQFDGYNTAVSVPAAKAPSVSGGSLTLEGWFALGAYPWDWAPIVQQGDDDGYFLGVDSHGYPGFMVKVDGVWQHLSVPNKPPYTDANHLALFNWYHVAGTYNQNDGMMRLYINGKEVASKSIGKGGVQTVNADVRVGKAGIKRTPTQGTHDTHPSEFGFDGLIDEVKIYNVALTDSQISSSFANFNPGPAIISAPDMQKRRFPVPTTDGKFKAVYTHLPYYETWDNLWRFGDYADVVVGFDQSPAKFVFWRGVSYIPMMVNETNQWFTHEFNETGFTPTAPGDCEPMSDKGCRDSHVRIIENNDARVVVHWRYRLENPDYHWANYDENGWGDIADWHYYIYPDGVASKIMRCYTSKPDAWYEWNEQIAVLSEGQHPESVLRKSPVMTLVDRDGKATDYDWNPDPPKPQYKGTVIQKIYFTGQYHPFAIQDFNGGNIYKGERTWYSVFPSWNHWPTSQINSSGRNASFPDRAAHSSISHLYWPSISKQQGKIPFLETTLMEGMTDQPATSLVSLAKSWLNAPPVTNVSGGTSQGYEQGRRAYGFAWGAAPLRFQIAASDTNPIHNLCFEIKNWKSRTAKASLKINDVSQTPGPNFRQGVNIDTDGTYTLIVWVGMSANTTQSFEISEAQHKDAQGAS